MQRFRRRRVIAALGSVGAFGSLAGCSDGESSSDATPEPTPTATEVLQDPSVTEESVIDYPGIVDGAATVTDDGGAYTIEYEEPRAAFRVDSGFEGESDPAELRVSRDMTVDARAGFVAPIYDDDAGEFVYQIFANRAFVEYAEWNILTVDDGGTIANQGTAPFERIQGEVYGAGVAPGEIRQLFVVDTGAEALGESGAENLSGLVLVVGERETGTELPIPVARFGFEYDAGTGELTITHEEGDTIQDAVVLVVRADSGDEQWETPVAVGDTKTVTVEPDETVRVIWLDPNGSKTQTIDKWTGPDA